MTDHPIPEQTDELALRIFRAFYVRTKGEDSPVQSLTDMAPGIANIWRQHALVVQDVLGIEGVSHAMAAMDNIAAAHSRPVIERVRVGETVTITPDVALRNVFGDAT